MSKQLRFFNMYLTTTISVSLVLLLIGCLGTLLLASNTLINRIKENVSLTVVLNEEADSLSLTRCNRMLDHASYCKQYTYISQQEALTEHINNLGEDPTVFLGYNPLQASYEIHPTAEYAHPDSIAKIDAQLSALPYVDRVIYQQDIVALLSTNFTRAAWSLLIITAILLLIAITLIVNTVRLQIYSKRFIIRTMSLVGATAHMIRAPFVRRNFVMGLAASVLAITILGGIIYYIQTRLGIILFELTYFNIGFLVALITISGILITTLAAAFSTGRYLRMNAETLYRI